ncbi:hypothetical protein ACFE04_000204 [Oxalis oulophora]
MAEEDHRRSAFLKVYDTLKSDLLNDPAFEHNTVSRQWLQRMLDYNVPGGKLNRGLSVIDSYKLLKDGQQLTEEEIFLSSALGWCVEWLQAYFLVLDDIMDSSHTRRGRPCWFRLPQVGMVAANDGILLRNHIPRILKKHFRGKAYYVDMVDLFNEVEFQTACGQMIDLITTIEGEKDISKYSTSLHQRIVQYKTAYYSFYLPVACALLMSGENLESHVDVKNILVEMGVYFQVQDDYLDCFGDPETIGKIGTDIEDYKCSWLVVKALEICNEEQKKTLYENYGKEDPACVAKVKVIYDEVNLKGVYEEYESKSYEKLVNSIEAHPNKAIQALLKSFLAKIYKRQKEYAKAACREHAKKRTILTAIQEKMKTFTDRKENLTILPMPLMSYRELELEKHKFIEGGKLDLSLKQEEEIKSLKGVIKSVNSLSLDLNQTKQLQCLYEDLAELEDECLKHTKEIELLKSTGGFVNPPQLSEFMEKQGGKQSSSYLKKEKKAIHEKRYTWIPTNIAKVKAEKHSTLTQAQAQARLGGSSSMKAQYDEKVSTDQLTLN